MLGVILAAGKGTRLAPYTDAVNKEMLPITDTPIIEYSVRQLAGTGVKKIFVVISESKEQIMRYLRDGSRFGVQIAYLFQDMRNKSGTAKAIGVVEPWVNESFVVLYGDSFFHPSNFMRKILKSHQSSRASVTIGLHEVKSAERFGIVTLAKDNRVVDIVEKPNTGQVMSLRKKGPILANSGPLVFETEIFDYIHRTKASPSGEYLITDTIRMMNESNLPVYGFKIPNSIFWTDIGTPEARLRASSYMLRRQAIGR